jgi:hypothetical protein
MKGYSEEELEDWLSKIENVNKKVWSMFKQKQIGQRYRRWKR